MSFFAINDVHFCFSEGDPDYAVVHADGSVEIDWDVVRDKAVAPNPDLMLSTPQAMAILLLELRGVKAEEGLTWRKVKLGFRAIDALRQPESSKDG